MPSPVTPNLPLPNSPSPAVDNWANSLTPADRLNASLYVLQNQNIPVPQAWGFKEAFVNAKDDVDRAIERIKRGDEKRFTNLLGSLGGMAGVMTGVAVGALLNDDRGKWTAVMIGTIVGTVPPALVGSAIDRVVDKF